VKVYFVGTLNNFQGLKKYPVYWIDADGVPCNSGQKNSTLSIACPDNSNMMSGYISDGIFSDIAYNNTNPRTGYYSPTSTKYWGAFGFNLSEAQIPSNAYNFTVRLWVGMSQSQPSCRSPPLSFQWKTKVYSDYDIDDNSGLDKNDLYEGKYSGVEIIWEDYCSGDFPCNTWITLVSNNDSNPLVKDLNYSLHNGHYFHIAFKDTTSWGSYWCYRDFDIFSGSLYTYNRTLLKIEYSVSEPTSYTIIPSCDFTHFNNWFRRSKICQKTRDWI
jgi:hypothetical protein